MCYWLRHVRSSLWACPLVGFYPCAPKPPCNVNQSAAVVVNTGLFEGAVLIWTKTIRRHCCRIPGLLYSSWKGLQSCACPEWVQMGISPPQHENCGQGFMLPWCRSARLRKWEANCKENFKPGNAKNIINNNNKTSPQTSPDTCYIMNFLQCRRLSPSRVPWARLRDQGEVGWRCCHSPQMSCGGQAASSAWCSSPRPLQPAVTKKPPSQKCQKMGTPDHVFGETQGFGFPTPPYHLPSITYTFAYSRAAVLALEKETVQKLLPFCQKQQPLQMESSSGHCEFWGASSLCPVCGGARPPARLVYADGASTQSTFLTFSSFSEQSKLPWFLQFFWA